MESRRKNTALIAIIGLVAVMVILLLGTLWTGRSARKDTEEAVRAVSLLYLDELAGRREQVVAENLRDRINDMQTTLDLLTEDDLASPESLQDYQTKMKRLFGLERYAFIGADGTVYTSSGTKAAGEAYAIDHTAISEPQIYVHNLDKADKKVVIAAPAGSIPFRGSTLEV